MVPGLMEKMVDYLHREIHPTKLAPGGLDQFFNTLNFQCSGRHFICGRMMGL